MLAGVVYANTRQRKSWMVEYCCQQNRVPTHMYNVLMPIPRSNGGGVLFTLIEVTSRCLDAWAPLRLLSFRAAFCAAFFISIRSRAVCRFLCGPGCFW